MRNLATKLRDIRCFNNWDLLTRFGTAGDVAIEYVNPDARSVRPRHTAVWAPRAHPKLPPPPNNLQAARGRKEFLGKQTESLGPAIAWANQTFGHVYVKSPFRGYVPEHVLDRAKEAVDPDLLRKRWKRAEKGRPA